MKNSCDEHEGRQMLGSVHSRACTSQAMAIWRLSYFNHYCSPLENKEQEEPLATWRAWSQLGHDAATTTLGQPWGAAWRPAPQQPCAAPSPSTATTLLCNFLEPKLCLTYAWSSARLTVFKLSCLCYICREMLCLSASQDRQSATHTEVTILCVTT